MKKKPDVSIAARAVSTIVAKPVTVEKTTNATGMVKQDPDTQRYYIPQGTIYPTNDDKAIGIVESSVYVDEGDAVLTVILRGHLRLDVVKGVQTPTAQAIAAMNGITLEDLSPTI